MPGFNPDDPYPLLLDAQAPDYAGAQAHAAEVDRWLGMETERIEAALLAGRGTGERDATPDEQGAALGLRGSASDQQLWIGLPVQAMLTPYTELRAMLARVAPEPGQHVVDLGAGYGRLGLVIARHHPGVRFTGYEYVAERVNEGCRIIQRQVAAATVASTAAATAAPIELLQADISAPGFAPPAAEIYFIYDYGTRAAIEKTLQDLRAHARRGPLTVIGRGRASRDAIERGHPWLSQVRAPGHHGNYSIYRSA